MTMPCTSSCRPHAAWSLRMPPPSFSTICRAWTTLALRRGKPCTHRAFPPWAADMAPVFMVTLAYQISLDNPFVPAGARIEAALALSRSRAFP